MYKYYQPNKKDIKDKAGDCVLRAICKATNQTWLEVFDGLTKYARELQMLPNAKPVFEAYLFSMGYKYHTMGRGEKLPVEAFAKYKKSKSYILYTQVGFGTHLVTVDSGTYYDTWDCGKKKVYGYYEKEEQ